MAIDHHALSNHICHDDGLWEVPMEFVEKIRNELKILQKKRNDLAAQLTKMDQEIYDHVAALRVAEKIKSEGSDAKRESQSNPTYGSYSANRTPDIDDEQRQGSVKAVILEILTSAYPNGLQAYEIREIAKAKYDLEINPSYLTVALGRYKSESAVRNSGRNWFFVPQETSVGRLNVTGWRSAQKFAS